MAAAQDHVIPAASIAGQQMHHGSNSALSMSPYQYHPQYQHYQQIRRQGPHQAQGVVNSGGSSIGTPQSISRCHSAASDFGYPSARLAEFKYLCPTLVLCLRRFC
jgi:hypothetical protein